MRPRVVPPGAGSRDCRDPGAREARGPSPLPQAYARYQILKDEERLERSTAEPSALSSGAPVARLQPILTTHFTYRDTRLFNQDTGVVLGEPPKMSPVEDAFVAARPGTPNRKLPERFPVTHVRQADDQGTTRSQ